MSRLSQIFWALEAKEMPTIYDSRVYFTSFDLTNSITRMDITAARRRIINKKRRPKIKGGSS